MMAATLIPILLEVIRSLPVLYFFGSSVERVPVVCRALKNKLGCAKISLGRRGFAGHQCPSWGQTEKNSLRANVFRVTPHDIEIGRQGLKLLHHVRGSCSNNWRLRRRDG